MLVELKRQFQDSEELLISEIKRRDGFTFDDLLQFSKTEGVSFGPQKNIFDVVNEYAKSGFLELDESGEKIIYVDDKERKKRKGLPVT